MSTGAAPLLAAGVGAPRPANLVYYFVKLVEQRAAVDSGGGEGVGADVLET